MSKNGTADDKRRCSVCGRLLQEAHASGETSTTLSSSHSGESVHICSNECWDKAMKKLGIDA